MTDTGRAHPLLASRPAVFDALCSHLDEIETLPPNSQVLAANEVSAVQAIAHKPSVAAVSTARSITLSTHSRSLRHSLK